VPEAPPSGNHRSVIGAIVEWKPRVWGTKMSRVYSAKKFVRPDDRSRPMGDPEWAKELDVFTYMLMLNLTDEELRLISMRKAEQNEQEIFFGNL
jgi:uncharacterized DUF497 family protein